MYIFGKSHCSISLFIEIHYVYIQLLNLLTAKQELNFPQGFFRPKIEALKQ